MEPYKPNEPFIKLKLDGSLLDRMVEYGIPLTRAIQYFRDNPEGSALETLKLAAEDVVPFYGNYRNNGDWSDYAKEAVMMGIPVKVPSERGLIRVPERKINVDPERTAAANEHLRNRADEILSHNDATERLRNAANRFRQYAEVDGPIPFDQDVQLFGNPGLDLVYGNTNDYRNIINEVKSKADLNDDVQFGRTPVNLMRIHFSRNSPNNIKDKLKVWKEGYNRQGGNIEDFNKDLAEYYSSAFFNPRPLKVAQRITESGEPYNFTINELKNLAVPTNVMKDIIYDDFWRVGNEELFERIRAVNPEAADRIGNLYRQYTDLLADQSIPASQKVEQLNLIDNTLNSEFEALGIE